MAPLLFDQLKTPSERNKMLSTTSLLWITAFGFPPDKCDTVTARLRQCGTIVSVDYPTTPHCNFLHVEFANDAAVAKALALNGTELLSSLMLGVVPYRPVPPVESVVQPSSMCDGRSEGAVVKRVSVRWADPLSLIDDFVAKKAKTS